MNAYAMEKFLWVENKWASSIFHICIQELFLKFF